MQRQLPWYSPPEARHSFPSKAVKRRKQRQNLHAANDAVALPSRAVQQRAGDSITSHQSRPQLEENTSAESLKQEVELVAEVQALSEEGEEGEATGKADQSAQVRPSSRSSPSANHLRKDARTAVPIVPALPNIAGSRQKPATGAPSEKASTSAAPVSDRQSATNPTTTDERVDSQFIAATLQPTKAAAKSWADLVRTKGNSAAGIPLTNGTGVTNGTQHSRAGSLAEALSHFQVDRDEKVAFLEPRGLVNTGNMCYMNSVGQIRASDPTLPY